MNVIEKSYPIFELNQTLSHHDLNLLFNYLNKQDILTRINSIGTGIISGLDVRFSDNKIRITKGCGITSEGNIIVTDNDVIFEAYSEFKFEHDKSACSDFPKVSDTERIFELQESPSGTGRIEKRIFDDYKVVIFCESTNNKLSCCGAQSDIGQRKIEKEKFLLMPNSVFLKGGDSLLDNKDTFETVSPLPRLDVIVRDIYQKIKEKTDLFFKEIVKSHRLFKAILKNDAPSNIFSKSPTEENINQNHYNFLCDLIEAYKEFWVCGEKVLLDYRPSAAKFPCYLILNGKYRHHFRPATANNDYSELRWLWERLVTMIQYFNETPQIPPAIPNAEGTVIPQSAIRLTPSVYGAVPLSEKAVPYYYKKIDVAATSENQKALDDHLYKAWTDRKNKIGYWYGWYDDTNASASYLNYDIERYNFVRIEGHIAVQDSAITVRDNIKGMASKCQIPIEVIALNIKNDCILQSNVDFFVIIKGFFNDSVSSIVKHINANVTIIEEETAIAVNANTAPDAAAAATAAAKKAPDAAAAVGTAVPEAAAAATAAAATATEAAKKTVAADAATAEITGANNAATTAAKAAKTANDAAKTAATAAHAALLLSRSADLESYLKDYNAIADSCNTLVSFALSNEAIKENCKEIISFLHWLDSTQTKYQQCKEFSSFVEFKKKHPGLQHKSGVPIGGTFILVYNDDNKVIADFCLPYRVTQPD